MTKNINADISLFGPTATTTAATGQSVSDGAALTTGWVARGSYPRVVAGAYSNHASVANGFKIEEAWDASGTGARTVQQATLSATTSAVLDGAVILPYVKVTVTDVGGSGSATIRLAAHLRAIT